MTLFSVLLLRRVRAKYSTIQLTLLSYNQLRPFSSVQSTSTTKSPDPAKPTSLSARMSFVFDQIDQIEKDRAEKDQTLQRIRAWRESRRQDQIPTPTLTSLPEGPSDESRDFVKNDDDNSSNFSTDGDNSVSSRRLVEVELAHPWPEWVEFMERLVQQNYFDHKRRDEDKLMEGLGFSLNEAVQEEGFDFTRDWKTVQTAVLNFGRDRFDILRSLSRQDLQLLVGYGCPSADKKVVFSAKLLRKHVHLDEGDVCSSCSLRSSCEKAYLLTNKEDEARTIDVMRVLLTYGFDPVNGSVTNKSLLRKKSVKTVVRKLLHEVVKLSAVPIDPNLPPPVIKKPPPKVKQPPPQPKKRVGRDDVEMKKGDWLCPKCDFMNFAKNTVCLQCDAKRPKRQLLPGEWECPQCNFLNYRRNVVCFHCEHKRPPDEYNEPRFQERQRGPLMRLDKISSRPQASEAWNFDFDDNESDGADVAAFEYADSQKMDEDFPHAKVAREDEDGFPKSSRHSRMHEREPNTMSMKPGTGFSDFDDEEDDLDSYELDTQNERQKNSPIDFSELEDNSDSDDVESTGSKRPAKPQMNFKTRNKPSKPVRRRASFSGSEEADIDFDSDEDLPIHPNWRSSHVADFRQKNRGRGAMSYGSDDDIGVSSSDDIDDSFGHRKTNKWVSGRRGRSFSDLESDDDRGELLRHKKMGPGGRDFPRARGGKMSERRKFVKGDKNMVRRGSPGSIQEDEFDGHGMNSRDTYMGNRGSRQRGGSNQRQSRFNTSDNRSESYLDDERYRRPRINVR